MGKSNLNSIQPKLTVLILIVVISLWGMYLRVEHRNGFSLRTDELYQLSPMKGSFSELVRSMPRYEFSSYISSDHYLIYPFYKAFHEQVWGLAFPHVVATVFSFYLFYLICSFYYKTAVGWVIGFLVFSLNATLIDKAFEVRAYPMLILIALACFYAAIKLDQEDFKITLKKQWLFFIFYLAAIWFHPYCVLYVLLPLLYFFALRYRQPSFYPVMLRAMKFFGLVLAVAMPLWLISMFGRPGDYGNPESVFLFTPSPFQKPLIFFKDIFCNLTGDKKMYALFLGVPLAFLLSHPERHKQVYFFGTMVALHVLFMFLLDIKVNYYFIQRQYIGAMPFFALLIGWCWDSVFLYYLKKTGKSRA